MKTAEDVVRRVRSEYLEMPGMRLTRQQVQRLCGIEPALCKAALDSMVETRFLCIKPDGTYARVSDGDMVVPRPHLAKAALHQGRIVAAS